MPQLDLHTYVFTIATVFFSFILLYCILLVTFSNFWIVFFRVFAFKFNSLMISNFFIQFSYLNKLKFLKTILARLNTNKSYSIIVNIFLLKEYASFLIYFIVALLISCLLFFIANYLNERFLYREKVSSYECGFEPFSDARAQVNIHFYIVALLFVIFDVEVIYFLPWAINIGSLGILGYWSMLIFNFFLISGFLYELNRGVFNWADLHDVKEFPVVGVDSFSDNINTSSDSFSSNSIPSVDQDQIKNNKNINVCYSMLEKGNFLNVKFFKIIFLIIFFLITLNFLITFYNIEFFFGVENDYLLNSKKTTVYSFVRGIYREILSFIAPVSKPFLEFLDWFGPWHYHTKLQISCVILVIARLGYTYTVMFEDIIRYNLWTREEIEFFYEYAYTYCLVFFLLLLFAGNFPQPHFTTGIGVYLVWVP